jgi:Hemerythrin HHE cation binding domain
MTVVTSAQEWSAATTPEVDRHALAGEHALLLRDLRRRTDPVLALIAAHIWPDAELRTLIRFVRTDVLRQASDEEVLLYPTGAAAPFTELSAEHARLYALADCMEQAAPATCPLPELGRLVAELLRVFEHHLLAEQAALAVLAATHDEVPAAADLRSGAQAWLSPTDTPVMIRLDALPRERAVQICIERLLRLRAGQSADVHSSRGADLQQVCRWMRDFDATGYGFAPQPSVDGCSGLRVSRRHAP